MSLVTRVSGFFLLVTAAVLAGFSATLHHLAAAHFERDLDEKLVDALDALSTAADIEPGLVVWRAGRRHPVAAVHPDGECLNWAVFDGSGRLLDRWGDAAEEDLAEIPARTPSSGHDHFVISGDGGRSWRVTARRILPGKRPGDGARPPGAGLVLATAMSLAPMEADLRRVGLTLAGLSAALWALTALVGRRVCRRALRPVAEMAAAAAVMTAAESDQGLPSPGTGDELEHLARSFNGLIRRLRDAMARQERFAGDASHQLRTPLTALISEVELACRRDRPADEYRATLRAILGDAVRLRQIVEALLFLARADLAADRLDLEPVELSTWLPSYLERWAHHERGCDIRHEVADRPPLAVAAHSPLLGQLLDNLLDNACKYSPPGTPVVVRLGRDAAAGEVRLSVEDAGEGLTAEELAHAFEPFYRAPRAHRLGKPGVGLGLAVAQRIASAFDGRIDAESHPGRGARFIARFPEAST